MSPNKWALLIAVDFYFRGNERQVDFHHLRGCVRDVSLIEDYLRSINVHNIERLTASYHNNDDNPQESDQTSWPTYDNIKAKIDAIRSKVKPGDLVYIHYSGHGILRHKLEDLDLGDGDAITGTALALTDVAKGGAYLTSYQLGVWVRRLVEINKVRVNLTIDSCHSGRGLRNNDDMVLRTSCDNMEDKSMTKSDYEADNHAAEVEAGLPQINTGADQENSNERNANVKRSWLSSPTGCTVLTACQLDQTAGEARLRGGEKNGILTHCMIDYLNRWPGIGTPTYTQIAQHVKFGITTNWPDRLQTPVLHGDSFYEFFGNQQHVERPAYLIRALEQPGSLNKIFRVDVGAAQGVAVGAIYSVYPSSWCLPPSADVTTVSQRHNETAVMIPKIRIVKTFPFESDATLIDAGCVCEEMAPVTGSLAVLDTWSLPSQQHVGFSLPPKNCSDKLKDTIEKLTKETRESEIFAHCSLIDVNASHLCDFIVSIDDATERLEIRDSQDVRVSRVPAVSVDGEGAGAKILHILNHLARFKALQSLNYISPSTSLSTSQYVLEMLGPDGNPLEISNGVYQARDNQDVTARFVNKSVERNVHVAIFMFNATWSLERMYPEDGQPTAQVAPGEDQAATVDLTMCIPPERAHPDDPPHARDLLRAYVYVGAHPPSWDELLLPDIPANADLIPTGLQVDPLLGDGEGEGGDSSRNGKRSKRRQVTQVNSSRQWTVLDLWVHTT
ncbi:hypothetical protein ANO14919_045160 [Xylariales sp. No.14919]|nr:hypothetical protein ANO14919_045160 [Xylariales sp. No.14919]